MLREPLCFSINNPLEYYVSSIILPVITSYTDFGNCILRSDDCSCIEHEKICCHSKTSSSSNCPFFLFLKY